MGKKEIFKEFIDKHDILIVDKNPGSRNRLLKIMYDLGSQRHMIHTAGNLAEAQEIIRTKNIGVVLSDYYISGGSGFDLFKFIREKEPDNKKLSLTLVTSNISQTAVAKAAEEDVDSFIIKPYTIQSIQENLISTISSKVQPSDYISKINEGKELMGAGRFEESISVFTEALLLNPRPALALFYLGQAEYLKNQVNEAHDSYQKGLTYNNIHYKCLVGLYEIFMQQNHFNEAYQVVKKIARFFPANPDRLTQIVRLAIKTENYQDMQFFYEIFTSLEQRNAVLINYIGAGMYISGKHSLLNNDHIEAMKYFENIAISCSEFTKFVRAMITLLVDFGMAQEAEKYLNRFDPEERDKEDYLVSEYIVTSKLSQDYNAQVKKGLDIYNRNIRDYMFMKVLVNALEKCGYKDEKIAPFRAEILELWPDKITPAAA